MALPAPCGYDGGVLTCVSVIIIYTLSGGNDGCISLWDGALLIDTNVPEQLDAWSSVLELVPSFLLGLVGFDQPFLDDVCEFIPYLWVHARIE